MLSQLYLGLLFCGGRGGGVVNVLFWIRLNKDPPSPFGPHFGPAIVVTVFMCLILLSLSYGLSTGGLSPWL